MKMFNYYNYFSMSMLPLISLSSSDWVLTWFYMEMMLVVFYINFFKINMELMMNLSSIKYFIIQSLSGLFLLTSGNMLFYHEENLLFMFLFCFSLMLKLGVFPFHFWVISVVKYMNLLLLFFLFFTMKIIPLGLMNIFISEISPLSVLYFIILIFSVISMLVGSLMGNNFSSLNSMLGSSSISHSGWFMFSIFTGLLYYYFFIYGMVMMFLLKSIFSFDNMTSYLSLISLSGLPPFSVFFAKLKILMYLVMSEYFILIILMMMLSVVSLKFYLKFSFFYFLKNNSNNLYMSWFSMMFLMLNFSMFFILM
uniref:NADH-ubiquinone oxidoreductase chain 2 n=1 Tax=Succineidae gen. n. sp. z RM-2021 TaxID=2871687 RepID=A0A977XSK0_9EUPU|nr:NADH dehydrogenase subunit 2 [Succineidae gen. n. sp. z RM-2021]